MPMFVVALALLGLIVLLATLQYQWLGRISDAEREGTRSALNTHAAGFARDFDAEVTRAFLLFQIDSDATQDLPERLAMRYDRWQTSARYPRMVKDVYLLGPEAGNGLMRFNAATHVLEPSTWPAELAPIRAQLTGPVEMPAGPSGTFLVRAMPPPVWDGIPALLIPTPTFFFSQDRSGARVRMAPAMTYTILLMDRDYIVGDMLPALAQQYFRPTGDGFNYELAVVSAVDRGVLYHSVAGFAPAPDASADATVDMFQVRMQDFAPLVTEIRRFTSMVGTTSDRGAVSIVVEENGSLRSSTAAALGASTARFAGTGITVPRWRLIVKHPSGSLEAAVDNARDRNLIVSTSILAVLAASMALLVLSTRRAQQLAHQQLEFVAAVSHELRTPLAVIRSAGENLADGVVHDPEGIRKYGNLVRDEGRRLTEMVEQILEFAGIQSGQRGFALRPVSLVPLLHDVVDSSRGLTDEAELSVEFTIDEGISPVLGDEAALRRVFQNLLGNAIKYGRAGGWIGIGARLVGREVLVTVADRGPGIPAAEQSRIFEAFYRTPDAVAAQIQGAGLGLSLVKRIVEAHGGHVTVSSAPGAGSEFTVALPAASSVSGEIA